MPDDTFDLWLGRMGQDRPVASRIRSAINRAGGLRPGRRSTFTGARIGRGAGVGAMLSSANYRSGGGHRRAVVKASIVRLAGKGMGRAAAHMRYLQRDGTTREGERGQLYGPADDAVDGKAFHERCSGDRHQFRFIVSAEDGAEYEDLKPLVRRWVAAVEQDLGTRLDWVAVDHFNTGHPHSHVIVRGKDETGKDLVIARNYMTHGLRARASELVDLDLGPRSPEELRRSALREIEQERFTSIDRRLLRSVDGHGLVRAVHSDPVEQALRAGRLKTLERLELASKAPRSAWRLADDLEASLRRMGERGDIMRTMQQQMREHAPERSVADHVIHDPRRDPEPLVGKVIARGPSDEHADRHYLIIDGVDGLSRYVDVGVAVPETTSGSIVQVTPTPVAARGVDRTIADIAAAHDRRYSVDLHLRHDPHATQAFAEAHVRRLEALRRGGDVADREPDGSWRISPDHLERVEAHERRQAARTPVMIETLSTRSIEQLPRHDGLTWLDREMVSDQPVTLGRGFGADVRKAMTLRQQWLVEQELAQSVGATTQIRGELLAVLQRRELTRIADQLSQELGLPFAETRSGSAVEGVVRRSVMVGDARFALVEKARDFTLVPWRPMLERAIGKEVTGIMRGGSISWTIGRGRQGPGIGGF